MTSVGGLAGLPLDIIEVLKSIYQCGSARAEQARPADSYESPQVTICCTKDTTRNSVGNDLQPMHAGLAYRNQSFPVRKHVTVLQHTISVDRRKAFACLNLP